MYMNTETYGPGEELFQFDRPPILLIGAGISKRYLDGFMTWIDLLDSVSKRIGIEERQFRAFRTSAEDEPGPYGPLPRLAHLLREWLKDGLIDGRLKAEDIFNRDRELDMYDRGVDPLKILVASETCEYTVNDSPDTKMEIDDFRKLAGIIPSVITTNYDCFLEHEIFPNFEVYASIPDYYFSNPSGIGEIYKVHGSVEKPESLVITDRDYALLENNAKIVTAKLLSMLCDYPMVILGSSMSDPDITAIIHDLISSLDVDKVKQIGSNIVYISYDESADAPRHGTATFESGGIKMVLHTLFIRDFGVVYRQLGQYLPGTSPTEIRKIRQLVKNIVLTSKPSERPFITLGIDNLDSAESRDIRLIVADEKYSHAVKEIGLLSTDSILDDVLNKNISLNADTVLRFFEVYPAFHPNMYLPLYPYIKKAEYNESRSLPKVVQFLDLKTEQQFPKKINEIKRACSGRSFDPSDPFKDSKKYLWPSIVISLFLEGKISKNHAEDMLRSLHKYYKTGTASFDTNFKFAVTYLSSK